MKKPIFCGLLGSLLVGVCGTFPSVAATVFWTGTAADGNWASGTNWSNGTGPSNSLTADIAAFNTAGFSGTSITSLGGADRQIAGLVFNTDAAGNITIAAGNTLTIGSSGIDAQLGTGTHSINAAVVLGASQTWNNLSGNLFALGGTLTTGGNTLTLSGSSGFTVNGLTSVNGTATFNNTGTGALSLAGGATLTSNLTLNGTGGINIGGTLTNSTADRTLTVNNPNVTINNISLTEGTTGRTFVLNAATGVTVTVNGVITNGGSGNSAFRVDGLGTVVLNGANTFTHELRVYQGTVRVNATNTAGNQSNAIVFANNSALPSGYLSTLDINGAGVAYNLGGNIVYAAAGGNSGTSTIMGTGTLNLNGNRTFDVRPSAGTATELVVSATIADGSGSGRTVTKTRNGTLVFSGDNSYTGSTTVSEGVLRLDYGSNTGTKLSASAGLTLGGGTLELVGNSSFAVTETTSGVTFARGANYVSLDSGAGPGVTLELGTFAAPAVGATVNFDLPAVGAVRGTFSNTNGILGGFATVNRRSFAANDGSGNVAAAVVTEKDDVTTWLTGENLTDGFGDGYSGTLANSLLINSLTFSANSGSSVTLDQNAVLTVRSGGILVADTVGTEVSEIIGGGLGSATDQLYVHQHNALVSFTINSNISGGFGLVKSGAGTLVLDSAGSAYTGTTFINQGTLVVQGGNAIGDSSTVDLDPVTGARLELRASETIGTLQGGGADGGNIAIGAHTLTINQASQQTFAGVFSGSGTIVKSGAGNLLLSNSAGGGFTGTVVVNQGRFWLDTTSILNGVTSFTVNGAELLSQQDQSSSTDHIGNSASIILNNTAGFGGLWVQNENQDATRTEDTGAITLGAGHNTIQADTNGGTNASRMAELLSDGLNRNNHATALVRGQNLGASSGARGRIRFNLAQPAGGVGGGGANNSTTITILPYLVGDTTITGLGNSFVTNRDTAVGLRPLDLINEYLLNETNYNSLTGITEHNVRFSTDPLAALTGGSKTINSLVLDSSAEALEILGSGADTLTITSGAILATTTVAGNSSSLGGFAAIAAGGANDYIVYVTNATHTFTINSTLSSANALVKSGAGTLVLGAASNSVSEVYFNQGLIEVTNLSQLGSGNLNFFGGGLRWAAGASFDPSSRTTNFSTGGAIFDTNGNDVVVAGSIGGGGAGGFTKAGAGVLTLGAAASYQGVTTVTGGTLRLGLNQAVPVGDLVVNNGTFDLQGFNVTMGRVTLANAAGSAITGTGVLTSNNNIFDVQRGSVSAVLAGSSTLVKTTNQTVVLSGNNTYTGVTEVRDGVLSFNSIGNVGAGPSALGAPVTAESAAIKMGLGTTGGALNYTGAGHSTDRRIDLVGGAATSVVDADGTGALVLTGNISAYGVGAKALTLQGASAVGVVNRVDGDIQQLGSSSLGVNKSDANTWELNGNNTYTGTTNVNNGKLRLGHANALGSTSGGTSIAGGGVGSGIVLFGGITYAAETITMGAKSAASNGASIISESGNNTWTGTVNFTTGGGFYGIESQAGKLTMSGIIKNETNTSARTLTLLGAGDGEVTGSLQDGDAGASLEQLSLAFTGSGTWTLSGNNTYSGTTTVNASASSGTLRLVGATTLGTAATPAMTINAGVLDLAGTWSPVWGALTMGGGASTTTATLAIGSGLTVITTGTSYSNTNNAQGAVIEGDGTFALGAGTYEFNIADSTGAAIEMDVLAALSGSGVLRKTGQGVLRIQDTSGFTGTFSLEGGTFVGDIGSLHLILDNSVFGTSGNFTRALGTTGNTVEWAADRSGGFAAFGGALQIDLDFAGPLVWGSTPQFLTDAGQLWLNSTGADNVVTWTDAIDFNNTALAKTRVINVFDNNLSTADKAVFTSVISRSGTGDTLVDKTGAGALELTADNSAFDGGATGGFRVSGGSLQFTSEANLGAATNRLIVNGSGAFLEFIGSTSLSGTRDVSFTAAGSGVAANGSGGAVMALDQITASANGVLGGLGNGTVNDLSASATLSFTKTGTGSWRVIGATTSAAATDYDLIVSGGTLELAAANAFVGDDFTVNNGGTLLLSVSGAFSSIDDGTVATGGILNLGSGLTHSMDALTISGGTIQGSGSTLGITGVTGTGTTGVVQAGVTLSMGGSSRTFSTTNAADVLTILGDVTGTGGMSKGGNGILSVESALSYSGTTSIGTGQYRLSGAGSALNSATFTIGDNNSADELLTLGLNSDTASVNRVGDTAAINFNGSTRLFVNGGLDLNYVETMGALGVTVGRGHLSLAPAGTGSVTLAASSLALNNRGILVVRGNNLGSSGAGGSRLVFTTAPAALGSGAASGNTTMSILDRVVVDDAANGGFGFAVHDAVNGVRALTSGEYASSLSGKILDPRQNVSLAGGGPFSGDLNINSLRLTGGTTSIDPGAVLNIQSGAILATVTSTLGGGGTVHFGNQAGVITAAGNTTAAGSVATTLTINNSLSGVGGLIISSAGVNTNDPTATSANTSYAQNVVNLSGNNSLLQGTVTINSGRVNLMSATTLSSDSPVTVNVNTTGSLDLMSNSFTLRNLAVAGGASMLSTGSGNATLHLLNTSTTTVGAAINVSGGGTLGLVKTGSAQLNFSSGNTTLNAPMIIREGILELSGSARFLGGANSIYRVTAGTLRVNNTSTNNQGDRFVNGAELVLRGGAFQFDNDRNSTTNYTETMGALTVNLGANNFTMDSTSGASSGTTVMTFASLNRTAGTGATMVFTNLAATENIGIGENNASKARLVFTTAPVLTNGIIGGWAYHVKNLNAGTDLDPVNFATYLTDSVTGTTGDQPSLAAFTAYETGGEGAWTSTTVANPAADVLLTANREVYALKLSEGIDLDLAGFTLNVISGGLIQNPSVATAATISGGVLTAGGTGAGELIFMVESNLVANTLTVSSAINDNGGGGAVTVVKTGTDTLAFTGTNGYTGGTIINQGRLTISQDASLGAVPGALDEDNIQLNGGELFINSSMTLNALRGIRVGASGGAITVASTAVLTYNGALSSVDNGLLAIDGDRTSSGTTATVGDATVTLSQALALTGSLQYSADGTMTLTGLSNTIARSLSVGMDQSNSNLVYNGGAGSSFEVGTNHTFANELNIGYRTNNSGTGTSATTLLTKGFLNLAGTENFTATVDIVRMGVITGSGDGGTAEGDLTIGVNSTIIANQQILLGDSQGAGNGTVTSNLVFGSGVNNVTTPLMIVASDKSIASVTIASGGTLNLGGFGDRTMDLIIAQNDISTGVSSTGTVDLSNGVLNASFDAVNIATKSGGNNSGSAGTLTLGTGANNVVANSLLVGSMTAGTASTASFANGTVTLGGGSFTVLGNVTLAQHDNTANGTAKGTLRITGGTFTASGDIAKSTQQINRSSAIVTLENGVLDLMDEANGDTTEGSITASQLNYRGGVIQDVAAVSLDGFDVSNGTTLSNLVSALILRDVTAGFNIALTGATANSGGILYEAAGGGSGGVIEGDVDLGTVSRTIQVEDNATAGADLTIEGVIANASGTAGVTKTGAGTLVMGGNNTYSGTTIVNAGTLLVNGDMSAATGAVTVANTATLGGVGKVGGNTNIQSGGFLNPGDTTGATTRGRLEFGGTLTLSAASVTTFELGGATFASTDQFGGNEVGSAGYYTYITTQGAGQGDHDQIVLTGSLGTITQQDGAKIVVLPGTYGGAQFGQIFNLLDWAATGSFTTSSLLGANYRDGASDSGLDLDLPDISGTGLVWDISRFGTDGLLVVVPEPGRSVLLLAGLIVLATRRRRQRC